MAVRIRDISFEEATACANARARIVYKECFSDGPFAEEIRNEWDERRGKIIMIETPPIPKVDSLDCDGPFYRTVEDGRWVCHHMVEIGD